MEFIIITIILLLFAIIAAWFILTYNKLVQARNKVRNQWSQIEVQLKKRFDLIPNLIEVVKGYAKHEKEVIDSVIEARNGILNAKNSSSEMEANNELSGALNRLIALGEAYPELKADNNFKQLQESLKDVEDKIAYARQFYNDTVYKYKNTIETFPTVLIAGLLGFKQEEFIIIKDEEKENTKIEI